MLLQTILQRYYTRLRSTKHEADEYAIEQPRDGILLGRPGIRSGSPVQS
jgi:hypothetical protein